MILRVCILSLAYVTVKRVENKYFRIEIGVRKGCIVFPWFPNVHINAEIGEVKMGMKRQE